MSTRRSFITRRQVLEEADIFRNLERSEVFVSLNAEKLYWLRKGALNDGPASQSVYTVDGKGGELFARWALGLKNRTKLNLPALLLSSSWIQGKRVFLLGATTDSNRRAVERLRAAGLEVDGLDGFRTFDEMLTKAREFDPALTFIGMGSPKQEVLAHRLKSAGLPGAVVCCGGAINTMSGTIDKCPQWLDDLYLEWAYRLLQQPARIRRLHRLLALPAEILSHRSLATEP